MCLVELLKCMSLCWTTISINILLIIFIFICCWKLCTVHKLFPTQHQRKSAVIFSMYTMFSESNDKQGSGQRLYFTFLNLFFLGPVIQSVFYSLNYCSIYVKLLFFSIEYCHKKTHCSGLNCLAFSLDEKVACFVFFQFKSGYLLKHFIVIYYLAYNEFLH